MAKSNLDLCFTEIEGVLDATVGIPTANIERGRRPRSLQGVPWAFMRSRASGKRKLVAGAKEREYEIEVDLFHRQGDVPEGTEIAAEMDRLQELLIDAFDAKTASTFPLLVGLTVIEGDVITRDDLEDNEDTAELIMSRTVIRFPFWESI